MIERFRLWLERAWRQDVTTIAILSKVSGLAELTELTSLATGECVVAVDGIVMPARVFSAACVYAASGTRIPFIVFDQPGAIAAIKRYNRVLDESRKTLFSLDAEPLMACRFLVFKMWVRLLREDGPDEAVEWLISFFERYRETTTELGASEDLTTSLIVRYFSHLTQR